MDLKKIAQEAFQDELENITNKPSVLKPVAKRNVTELPESDGSEETSSQPIGY